MIYLADNTSGEKLVLYVLSARLCNIFWSWTFHMYLACRVDLKLLIAYVHSLCDSDS